MLFFTFIVFSVLITMSNSNYIIGLQRHKDRSHCVRRHLHAHQETVNAWSWTRDENGRDRDRDVSLPRPRR